MGTSHHTIQIDANIKTHLSGINDVIKQLQNGLSEGVTKIDLTKGIGKDLSKLIANFQSNYSKINSLIQPGDLLKIGDAKNFQKAGDNIIEVFNTIQRIINDIGTKELLDAEKLFPNAFDSRITEVQELLKNFQKKTEELSTKQLKAGNLSKEVDNLKAEIARLDQIGSQANLEKLKAELKTAEGQVGTTQTAVESLRKALQDEFRIKWSSEESKEAKDQIEKYESKISELKNKMETFESKGIQKKGKYSIFKGKGINEWKKIAGDKLASPEERERASNVVQDLQTYNNLNEQLREQLKLLEQIDLYKSKKIINQDANLSDPKNLEAMAQLAGKSEEVTNALKNQEEATKAVAKAQKELEEAQNAPEKANQLQNTLNRKSEELAKLQGQIELLANSTNIDTLYQKLSQIEGLKINPEMLKSAEGLQQIMQQIGNLKDGEYQKLQQALLAIVGTLKNAEGNAEGFRGELNRTSVSIDELMSKTRQMDQLKHRIAYFFGLANSINLFRRAIQKALNTVKELDAVMTETAVVTDFTVGDMWEKLPEYAAQASNLGASIKDLYSATTLYYQQGLKTEAAMGVGIETMKMARIAGMEASDATTAMTAALRGFNMEVNEMNAQRVNDVYSELAAITAADTEKIATAMSKTASIASSANMEFETTAALLAQIIETTQEAPETAGTAMKTIIARFTEVKELFDEGMLTGKDEEGEEININKIDAALKTVGISLKDFLNGTKGIDDIFLELASKWDGLDLATQRYIATMAAGSRQQSRFIAMMSNYGRTTELVNAANNSAGASQEQFNKTLDSLEAKLQNLQNAWQEFLMGLANSELIKGAVELLTNVIKIINGMVKALSGENGLSKSVITLTLAIAGLSGASTLIKKIFGSKLLDSVIKSFDKIKVAAQEAGTTIAANLTNGVQQATGKFYPWGYNSCNEWLTGWEDRRMGSPPTPPTPLTPPVQGAPGDQTKTQPGQQPQVNTQPTEESPPPKSSVAGLRTVGIVSMLTGVLANNAAAALKANDANNAFAAGLETMGSTATIAGSAVTLLAPALKGIIGIGPLIGIVAGLSVAFGALSWAMKDAYNKSLEGRMEAAAKATKQAQEAAEEAKTAYDELLNTKSTYSDLQETLENLTQGTKEWKESLFKANLEVIKLLETYPMLAQHISHGNDGQLIITEEGWQELQNQKYEQMVNTQAMVYGNQMVELDLKREKTQNILDGEIIPRYTEDGHIDYERAIQAQKDILDVYEATPEAFYKIEQMTAEEFSDLEEDKKKEIWDNSSLGQMYGKYSDMDTEGGVWLAQEGNALYYNLEELIASDGLYTFSDELYDLANATGFTAEELYNMRNSVADYGRFIETYTQQIQTYADMFMTGIDAQVADSEFATYITSGLAKNYTQQGASEIIAKKNSYTDKYTGTDNISKLANDLITEGYMITDTTGSDETYRQVYEALSGQEAGGMSRDQLATAIAEIQVGKEWSNAAEDLIKKLDKLASTNEEQAKIASAMISKDISGLNISQIKKLEEMDTAEQATNLDFENIGEYAKAQGYADKKITELNEADQLAAADAYLAQEGKRLGIDNATDMLEYMKQNEVIVTASLQLQIDDDQFQAELEAQREDIIGGIDSVMSDGYTENSMVLSKVSTQILKNLSEQTSTMSEKDAKAYISNFEKFLSGSHLTEDQNEQISNYLSAVDWSDMTEAVNAIDYMQSMGIDPATIKNFWDVATNGANTYISSLSEVLNLTERMQGKIQNVNSIEKALVDGTATYDQMMELVNVGIDISNFQLTPEGWKASADEIEGATDKLRQYNAEQARAVANQQVEKWEAAKNKANGGLVYNKETGQFDIIGHYGIGGITSTDASGKLVGGQVNQVTEDEVKAIAQQLGENGYDASKETYDEFVARIQTAYDAYINLLNNGEDIQIIAEKTAAMAEAAKYKDADQARAMGASEESQIYVSQSEAAEADIDLAELEAYAAHLVDIKGLSKSMATEMAKDIMLLNKATEAINENWDQWSKDIKKIGTPEYSNALTSLQANMRKMLGTSVDLSEEFFKNSKNMDLVKKAAKGNQKAMNELQKAAARDLIKTENLEQAKELFEKNGKLANILEEDYYDLADTIADTDLEPGQVAGEELLGSINTMYQQAYMAAIAGGASVEEAMAQANAALASVGFEQQEIEFTEYEVNGTTPDGWEPIATSSITTADPTGETTVVKGASTKYVPGEKYKYTMTVPNVKSAVKKEEVGSGSSSSSGGGGGGGKDWKNPYDKYYNNVERINEELRTREKIERRYQFLLNKTQTKYSELVKNTEEQIASLERERKMREELLKGRISQMVEVETEYSDLSDYAWYNEEAKTIEIDWEKINALEESLDEELTTRVEKYIGELEKRQKEIEEEEDSLAEIEETLRDIRDQGKDEYFDLEEQIKEALIDSRQKEIDKLSEINETISDTNSRLIDAMQSSIEKYRQDRENKEKEEDLSDKQRRLAYLQQDTSGANDLDIMKLQEELEDEQQDYTDTLIDQKIDELQEQNDKAAEQREKQIELMQAQLDKWSESGEIWREVYRLIDSGMDSDGIKIGSELESILKEGASFEAMSNLEKMKWLEELENNVAKAIQWLMIGNSTESLLSSGVLQNGQTITLTTQDGKQVSGTLQEDGSVITSTGEVYKDVYRGYDGESFYTSENYVDPSQKEKEETPEVESTPPELTTNDKRGVSAAIYNGNYGWGAGNTRVNRLKEVFGENDIQKNYVDKGVTKGYTGELSDYSYESMKKKFKQYKTGGLADFTGPAWLDGTKSKPEYILNANQTKAFFNLVDVLGSLQNGSLKSTQNNGDNTFDIDINVESIGSDYDVEQLANTIKRLINDDARYRNNNAINLMR